MPRPDRVAGSCQGPPVLWSRRISFTMTPRDRAPNRLLAARRARARLAHESCMQESRAAPRHGEHQSLSTAARAIHHLRRWDRADKDGPRSPGGGSRREQTGMDQPLPREHSCSQRLRRPRELHGARHAAPRQARPARCDHRRRAPSRLERPRPVQALALRGTDHAQHAAPRHPAQARDPPRPVGRTPCGRLGVPERAVRRGGDPRHPGRAGAGQTRCRPGALRGSDRRCDGALQYSGAHAPGPRARLARHPHPGAARLRRPRPRAESRLDAGQRRNALAGRAASRTAPESDRAALRCDRTPWGRYVCRGCDGYQCGTGAPAGEPLVRRASRARTRPDSRCTPGVTASATSMRRRSTPSS